MVAAMENVRLVQITTTENIANFLVLVTILVTSVPVLNYPTVTIRAVVLTTTTVNLANYLQHVKTIRAKTVEFAQI